MFSFSWKQTNSNFFLYHNKKYGFLFIALVKINGIFNKDCPHNNIYDSITLWNKCHVRLYISKQTVYVPLVIKFNQFYFFFFSRRQVWFWLKCDPKSRMILVRVHFHFLKVYLPSHRNLEEKKNMAFNGRIKIWFSLTDIFIPKKTMLQHCAEWKTSS